MAAAGVFNGRYVEAYCLSFMTAVFEFTAFDLCKNRRHVSADYMQRLTARAGLGKRFHEPYCIRIFRRPENFAGRAAFNDSAAIHYINLVAHVSDHAEIVGDQYYR